MKTKVVQQTICNFWLTLVNVKKTLENVSEIERVGECEERDCEGDF